VRRVLQLATARTHPGQGGQRASQRLRSNGSRPAAHAASACGRTGAHEVRRTRA
jgi:hypothetical protein